jgi:hypothetical protein
MGAGNSLGLLFQIDADPSKAQEAIANFEASTGKSLEKATSAAKPFDDALLSNRENARLLSEELGVHLPRAVTSAFGKMLPEIAGLGTALLGVFAVEEAVKFGEKILKLRDDFNEVAQSERVMNEIGKENISLIEQGARKSEDYARQQLRLTIAQEQAQQATVDAMREAEHGLGAINPLTAQAIQAWTYWTGESKELKQAQAELIGQQKLLLGLSKIIGEDETERHKKAAEAAKHAAAEARRRSKEESEFIIQLTGEADRSTKQMEKWHEEWLKAIGMPEEVKFSLQEINRQINSSGLAAAAALPQMTALGGSFQKLTEAQRAALPLSAATTDALLRQAQHIHEVVAEMETHEIPARRRIELEYEKQVDAAKREIAALRNEYAEHKITRAQMEADEAAYTRVMVDLAEQRKKAEKAERDAQRESLEAQAGAIVDQIANLTGNVKAAAAIRGAYDAALAIEWWARFIASSGTDGHAALAATQYTLAAVEMFKLAGKSHPAASGVGAGAGGGGYREETYGGRAERAGGGGGGGGESERELAGAGLAPGAQGSSGGRLNVYILNESEQARFFADGINKADAAGHFMQVSTARRSAPAQG